MNLDQLYARFSNVKKDYIDIVSTDMFRLFINRKEYANASEERSIMLSEVAASILYRFLSDKDTEISISTDGVGRSYALIM